MFVFELQSNAPFDVTLDSLDDDNAEDENLRV